MTEEPENMHPDIDTPWGMTPTNDAPVTVERQYSDTWQPIDTCPEDGTGFFVWSQPYDLRIGYGRMHDGSFGAATHWMRPRPPGLAALASAPAVGSREAAMVTLRTDDSGRPKVWCDPEIADLIDALNTDALSTVASCSGHGHRPGIIMLADGRCLMVFRDREYAKAAEAAYPLDINGIASAPAGDGYVLMPRHATRAMVDAADACTDAYSAYNAMVEAGHVR